VALHFLGDREMEKTVAISSPVLTRFTQAMTAFFGQPFGKSLSFFIFRRGKNLPASGEGMGAGLSFDGGILLFLKETRSVEEGDAWLILHEIAHQWLGVGVYAGESGLEWFFEGTASWCAMTLAHDLGYLSGQRLYELLSRDAAHYLALAKGITGRKDYVSAMDFHQYRVRGGLLAAYGLDLFFRKNNIGGLRDFLAMFYRDLRGGPVSERDILGAMKKFSGGVIPEFILDFLEYRTLLPFQEWF